VTPSERVYLSLLGLADPSGRLEVFERAETLDFAETPHAEFERVLADLVKRGYVRELPRSGRATRRFQITSIERKAEADAFIRRRRDRVALIAAERARLTPGRAALVETAFPKPHVVRLEPIPGTPRRYALSIALPAIGALHGFVYEPSPTSAGFVHPPVRAIAGDKPERVLEWTVDFARAVRDVAHEAFVALGTTG
jgi:hypothetical protein